MNETYNPKLKGFSQNLRKNMTEQERHLWYDFLKTLPLTVHRQKVIGRYIADFYCASAKLVIELDGSQHYAPQKQQADRSRAAFFKNLGITVLRYSNADVNNNFRGVCEDILQHLKKPSP